MHRFHGCGYGYGFGGPPDGLMPTPTGIPASLIPPPPAPASAVIAATSVAPVPGTSGTPPAIPGLHSGVHHGMLCMPVTFCPLPGPLPKK